MEKQFKLSTQNSVELEFYLNGMSKLGWDLIHLQLTPVGNVWAIIHSKGELSNFAMQQKLAQEENKDGK